MKGLYIRTGSKKNIIVGKIIHREKKVWGEEHWIVNKEYCGKKLILKKDRRCSMHSHNKKDEVFYLQSGKVKMELKGTDHILNPGDIVHIPPQTPHRFTGLKDSEIFEFSTTHEEEDSYRTELSGHVEQERFDRQSALLKKFSKTSIIVIGDLMLDRYTYGSIDRISAEAPIPIVQTKGTKDLIGGAGNAAANICAIGARVRLIALCGKDLDGAIIKSLCKQKGIRTNLIFDPSRPTTLKHRITRNNNQQIVRIDTEETKQISAVQEQKILALLRTHAVSAHAILLSDYAKGVLTSKIFETAYALGKKHDIPVIVDPKPRGTSTLKHLQKATAITPNLFEAMNLLGETDLPASDTGRRLSRKIKGTLILTRGSDGMDIFQKGNLIQHFSALSPDVVDTSGAGDTVSAILTTMLAVGASVEDASDIANRAAAIVVSKRGVATISQEELLETL